MARDENMIAALKRERATYVAQGEPDRVAQVDEQLKHYGYDGEQDATVDPAGGPAGRTAAADQRTADSGSAQTKTSSDDAKTEEDGAGQTPAAKKTAAAPAKKTAAAAPQQK